jgi:hypothetical protein
VVRALLLQQPLQELQMAVASCLQVGVVNYLHSHARVVIGFPLGSVPCDIRNAVLVGCARVPLLPSRGYT